MHGTHDPKSMISFAILLPTVTDQPAAITDKTGSNRENWKWRAEHSRARALVTSEKMGGGWVGISSSISCSTLDDCPLQ